MLALRIPARRSRWGGGVPEGACARLLAAIPITYCGAGAAAGVTAGITAGVSGGAATGV